MSAKKAGTYGDNLAKGGRRLGRHLPRIASGDGEESQSLDTEKIGLERAVGSQQLPLNPSSLPSLPQKPDIPVPCAEDVAGLPGRIQLKAPSAPTSPSASYKLYGALWADTQRHLIQAYEYLCHVGEAQQWIEGCLGEELGFGVVEMEEGLRNGVVLAKLVRAFKGNAAIKKIYDAPKLDFRHSDNINHFFNFVREVGLPEGFIFELTDLYEKKNFPKVIYCIHALRYWIYLGSPSD
jgi:Ras GTPase-activating-like protein IQGAP2/3